MKLKKMIHDATTGEISYIEETDAEVAEREARVAAAQAELAAAETESAEVVTEEEIDSAKTVADVKALLKKMLPKGR